MKQIRKTAKRLWARLFHKSARYDASLEELEDILGYRFHDHALLTHALTHKSYIGPEDKCGLLSNERLEFLGDAVLNCLVTEHLYLLHPDKAEGQLSKMKSLIVSRKILGDVAIELDLGDHMILGVSEIKSGGRKRKSILSNAFEAIVGAIYLDSGLDSARLFLSKSLFCRIDEFLNDERNINYKSRILERSQSDGLGTPHYRVLATSGPEHAKKFTVGIEIAGVPLGEGCGPNKKLAQQDAAQNALTAYDRDMILSRIKGVAKDELVSD
ncbi:MAG: ribonuclease III [Chitinivibrionales bacterium]